MKFYLLSLFLFVYVIKNIFMREEQMFTFVFVCRISDSQKTVFCVGISFVM